MKKTTKATKTESRGRKSREKLKWNERQVGIFLAWFKEFYNKDGDKSAEKALGELADEMISLMPSRDQKPNRKTVCRAIQGAVSKKNRKALPKHYEMPLYNLVKDSESVAALLFPHLVADELGGDALPFRNIRHKRWQELLLNERPHPFPEAQGVSDCPPPFAPLPSDEFCYVDGWTLCLRSNVRYRLTFDLCTNEEWHEIEIVLYARVSKTAVWKRDLSWGAVTEAECPSEFTPLGEHWMVTCWGKRVIDRKEPWHAFVPKTLALDTAKASLKLNFLPPNRQDSKNGLPVRAKAAESFTPALFIEVVV